MSCPILPICPPPLCVTLGSRLLLPDRIEKLRRENRESGGLERWDETQAVFKRLDVSRCVLGSSVTRPARLVTRRVTRPAPPTRHVPPSTSVTGAPRDPATPRLDRPLLK